MDLNSDFILFFKIYYIAKFSFSVKILFNIGKENHKQLLILILFSLDCKYMLENLEILSSLEDYRW